MEEKKSSAMLPPEWRIVSVVNRWLNKWWRSGKVPAKAKAALCNGLLAAVTSSRGGCDPAFLRLADGLYDTLEGIRHVRSNCTTRFMNALVKFVGEGNAALDACGASCPRMSVPLRGGEAAADTAQSARVPIGAADTDRTPVPVGAWPVTMDADALGRTVVSVTIVRGRVTVSVTQDQSPRLYDVH